MEHHQGGSIGQEVNSVLSAAGGRSLSEHTWLNPGKGGCGGGRSQQGAAAASES